MTEKKSMEGENNSQGVDVHQTDEEKSKPFILLAIFIIAIGLLFTGLNAGVYFDSVLLKPFLQEIYTSQSFVGEEINTLASRDFSIFKALNTLVFLISLVVSGAWTDNLRTKIGNRIPAILIGAIIISISYAGGSILIPLDLSLPFIGRISPLITGSIIYMLIAVGFGFVWSPAYALLSDIFTKKERSWAALGIALFSAVGSFLGIILEEYLSIEFVMIAIGVCVIGFGIVSFLFLPKRNPDFKPTESTLKSVLRTPAYLISLTSAGEGEGRSVAVMFLVQICWGVATFLTLNYFANFVSEVNNSSTHDFGLQANVALILLGFSGLIFAGPAGIIINRLGKTRAAMVGSLVMGFAAFLIAQSFMWSLVGIIIIIFLAGFASIIITTVTVALPADIVPFGKEGQFMGLFVLAYNVLNPVVAGVAVFVISLNPDDVLVGYSNLFLIITIFEFIAVGLLTFVHYEDVVQEEYVSMRRKYSVMKETYNSYLSRFRRRR